MRRDSNMLKIDYEKLRAGDVVFCGGRGVFSSLIRLVTGGKNRSVKTTATHVGILVDFHGQILMAEMLGNGLSISSLEEYQKNKRRFMLGIYRHCRLNEERVAIIQKRIALDRRKTIEYDWKGILAFLRGEGSPEKFYCSEYVANVFGCAGLLFASPKHNKENISPEFLHTQMSRAVVAEKVY